MRFLTDALSVIVICHRGRSVAPLHVRRHIGGVAHVDDKRRRGATCTARHSATQVRQEPAHGPRPAHCPGIALRPVWPPFVSGPLLSRPRAWWWEEEDRNRLRNPRRASISPNSVWSVTAKVPAANVFRPLAPERGLRFTDGHFRTDEWRRLAPPRASGNGGTR